MVLEAELKELYRALSTLDESIESLLWAVVQAKPEDEGHALVDHYDAAATDLLGLVRESRERVVDALDLVASGGALGLAARTLADAQERWQRISRRYHADMVSYEQVGALEGMVGERGPDWIRWGRGVRDALGRCAAPLDEVAQTLLRCWTCIALWIGSAPGSPTILHGQSRIKAFEGHEHEEER